ncbi:hypothetical protein IWQ62_002677 [Dispira parvispora]|uniref:Secreted protein n=1 Tax=Dispira parvispora TaxID=1520584 RepID=A0A9W8AV81_9FUNG|nr:hypothetical protein IWQ62_002677 [Dispira parvispora]
MKVVTLFFVLQATVPAYLLLAGAASIGKRSPEFNDISTGDEGPLSPDDHFSQHGSLGEDETYPDFDGHQMYEDPLSPDNHLSEHGSLGENEAYLDFDEHRMHEDAELDASRNESNSSFGDSGALDSISD